MHRYTLIFLLIPLVVSTFGTTLHAKPRYGEEIRVAILKDVQNVSVSGSNLKIYSLPKKKTRPVQAGDATIIGTPNGFLINGNLISGDKLIVESKGGGLNINGNPYTGKISIVLNPPTTLTVVDAIPLEEYLEGVIRGEIPLSWPEEVIKTLAVAARTYALYKRTENKEKGVLEFPYDIEATIKDQVYKGGVRDDKVLKAIQETRGEVITKNNKVIKAYYHSTCGGGTEQALNVWGDVNNLPPVNDTFCSVSPHTNWRYSIARGEFKRLLNLAGIPARKILNIRANYLGDNPRAQSVTIETDNGTTDIAGNRFREMLGFDKLKSTRFTVKSNAVVFTFEGHGFGHGVGMCQWGAKGMADQGYLYKDILKFYYAGTDIKKLY